MWKKIALGCVVLLVVGSIVGGWAFYQFVYKPGQKYLAAGKEYLSGLQGLGEVAKLDERVDDRSAYAPPASGELSEEQVDRLIAVQRIVRLQLGDRFDALQAKYQARDAANGDRQPSFAEMMQAWRDFSGLLEDAKRAQVEALNAQGFSLEEYRWVKRQVYAAMGAGALGFDLSEMVAAAKEGRLDDLRAMAEKTSADAEHRQVPDWVPPRNAELVTAHQAELEDGAPLALLGI